MIGWVWGDVFLLAGGGGGGGREWLLAVAETAESEVFRRSFVTELPEFTPICHPPHNARFLVHAHWLPPPLLSLKWHQGPFKGHVFCSDYSIANGHFVSLPAKLMISRSTSSKEHAEQDDFERACGTRGA